MADFDIVDLTVAAEDAPLGSDAPHAGGQSASGVLGSVDTSTVAASLESLRQDLSAHITAPTDDGLHLTSLVVKLTLSAEGRVAFVAKGAAEACIEVTFGSKKS